MSYLGSILTLGNLQFRKFTKVDEGLLKYKFSVMAYFRVRKTLTEHLNLNTIGRGGVLFCRFGCLGCGSQQRIRHFME